MDAGSQERLQDPPNSDIPRESEPSSLGKHETFFNTCDALSNSQTVDSNKNPLFASQHDKRGQCTDKEQTHTGQNMASKCDMEQREMGTEKNYTSPQGVSDLEFDQVKDSGNTGNGNHFQNPESSSPSSKIQRESESRFLRVSVPFLTAADIARIKKGLSRSEEKTQTSGNGLKECDMEQEDMETKNMWKLRANRVEQIFSALNKQLRQFNWSRKLGLEFNVGFGLKQNLSVDSLSNSALIEIAKFALAINSSQQDFIMEILDYNFDLGLQSEHHRGTFACEVMDRARQLTSCKDAVKLSNCVFELPFPVSSINVVNQNVGSAIPELGSISSMEKCDFAPVCLPDSCAKSEERISQQPVDLYPWCKEIGLKLHVNSRQPRKKLESNTFTNGAMTEVMNFAEKLCGTFEQICLDILKHNFDLDSQSGDSDLARNILAQIPAVIEQMNLSSYSKAYKKKLAKDLSLLEMLDCQNDPTFEACGSGSSSATMMDQIEGRAVDIEYQNVLDAVSDDSSSATTMDQKMDTSGDSDQQTELNLKLWKLRANQIQQVLSIPHEEHCPLYSYRRCKNLGIDFNVGSGVKRNLDPKLLTNGIMVELSTFAIALVSARRHFITEILEYNFNLNLNTELCHDAFTQKIMEKICHASKKNGVPQLNTPFELPDTRNIQEPTYNKTRFCPKCYQARNQKLHQHESDTGPLLIPTPHAMTLMTVSTDGNCTTQNPSKAPSTTEETMMDSYPHCKRIGLDLCVNKHQPKDKLCNNVLTRGTMMEVFSFARKLSGTKNKVINDVLEHNFNIKKQSEQVNLAQLFYNSTLQRDGGLAWFDKVFVTHPIIHKPTRYERKVKHDSLMQGSEWKETIKKRKLALQTKEERNPLPSHNASVVESKRVHNMAYCFPICTEIGLDLDVTSKSGEKEKLDLNLLTTAVVVEINKFASKKSKHYFPGTVFDILDYNFDLSSQHYRRWEFTIATAFQVQALIKRYRNKSVRADEVFKLPFVFPPKSRGWKEKNKECSQEEPNEKRNEGSGVHQVEYHSNVSCIQFLRGVITCNEPWSHDKDTKSSTDPRSLNMQTNSSQVSGGCGSPLQGNMHIKEEENDPYYGDVKPEPDTEEGFSPHYDDGKTESVAGEVRYLVPVEPQGTLEKTGNQDNFQESTSSEILRKSESSCPVIQADECGLYGGEGQTQIPWNDGTESDIEQEEMERFDDYICPLEQFGLNSEVIDSGNAGNGNRLQSPTCSDLPRISEPSCLDSCPSSLTSTELSSSLPTANLSMDPPLTSQPDDEKGLCGGEEQTQTTKNAQNTCDMAQEETETENMWKLRAKRVEQILSAHNKEFKTFRKSKKVGLEFNVGFGPKQNLSVDSLSNCVLLEIAKFALAINSSQQDFIMEILEYNFDLGLQSQHHRNMFAFEIMDRVRQVKTNKAAVKVSNKVFELPGPMASIHVVNAGSVIPELSSILKIEKCDVPVCLPDSNAETSKHISCQSVDLYPWCKEIGLKLHVNSRQTHKKLEFNKLTNGAITEVTVFAEKLCGTFEQICLDILKHNFDLDLQNEDSDLARDIVARIPGLIERSNLLSCKGYRKKMATKKDVSLPETLDYQNQPNLNVCGSSSSSAPIIEQNEGSSVDSEQQNELNLKLWKLRANHVKRILSTPHEEHCPLYSYSRCKKLGIDFNLGSGEKQNLDSKLMTNGIIVEFNKFATELQSARKHFVTEILEYNFNLNLKNEACRNDFTEQIMTKIKSKKRVFKRSQSQFPFELPDMSCIQEPPKYCPKCYQYRTHKLRLDESYTGNMNNPHSHTMTDTVSAHSNCTAQNPAKVSSFTFSTVEEKIMDNYPCCKKIGLNPFVDRDQTKDKLDPHVLTLEVMFEVASFAHKLCGTKYKLMYELIKHNFNIGKHSQDINPTLALSRWNSTIVVDLAWLNKVYVFNPYPLRQPGHVSKVKRESNVHTSEVKEAIKKRKLALQTKEGCTLPSNDGSGYYPFCTVIGLDLDVTSKSRQKEKLDLKLLTRAVVMEMHTFATHQAGHYYPRTVFDILDYNFDLSSQHYRRWEFSIATASKVQSMVKQYCKESESKEVFKLPFVFDPNASQNFGENSNENSKLGLQPGHSRWISEDEAHIQASTNVPHETDMEQEEMENYYTCPLEESDLDSDEFTDLGNTGKDLPYSSQLDKKGFLDDEEQTYTPSHVLNKYEMEENQMEMENNLWKLRSNRIERILSVLNKQFGPFTCSKRLGLEFNVGFGPKQNFSDDSLSNSVLLEIAKFALAINSSQKDFMMEILEYNFDLSFQSQHHRNMFACKLMKRVRQLRSCENAVKFSDKVFELPGPMASIKVGNPSMGSAISPSFPSDSHAESKEDMSPKSVDLYPWCKGIGLKLYDNSQPHKKLKIKKLTNGAMTEVANLTEKLCGTFEQICLDILRHNFDLDLQSGDSDLARNILERIPAAIEHKNLLTYVRSGGQNNPDLDGFSDASSSAAIMDQKMGTSDQQTQLNLKLWKLRVNEIQQVLSTPHEEHCPLYSYSRCKNLGIDFNVGSGVKRNLDPTLLTNGIMVELNTFATALVSARKHFVTEILEYNFDLNLNNELSRTAFAQQTHEKCLEIHRHCSTIQHRNMPFELPDVTCIQNSTEKTTYCPKCYEARQLHQDGSNPGHMHNPRPHCMIDSVSADANCMAQMPAKDLSSTFSTTEEMIMNCFPRCKKIGLDLCVNKDQPKAKLDTNVLTRSNMMEVVTFSRNLCGTKNMIINDVLEHNFNIDEQSLNKGLAEMFGKETSQNDEGRSWFNEIFDFHSVSLRPPTSKDGVKSKCVEVVEWKETIKKRQLALQAKGERDANLSRNHQSTVHCYPICAEIGLDLDVTSKKKEKLKLKLLTTAVVLEIHKFASKKVGHYPRTVFDILDYNFDLSSQHYRRWEFSLATASKFQTIAKQCCEKPGSADEVFGLPFMFDPKASERFVQKTQNEISRKTSRHETDLEQKEMRPENSYTYPLEESDRDEDKVRDSGNTGSDDHLPKSCSLSSKIPAESGSRLSLNITDISCSLPTVNSKITPTIAGQPDNKGLCGNEEKTMPTEDSPKECELEQEDMEREMMWKLRSNRVEQIISALNNEFEPFRKSKKVGLEFNVGFGPKQNISVDFLSNHVLLEIARFALAINSSQKDFILEILEYNFDLGLHSQNLEHRDNFAFEVMDRVRRLRSGRDAITFSSEVFELPGLMLSVNMANQSVSSVNSEPSCISSMENAETVSRQSVGLYPWCKEIGLKLHVNNPQPHKKLRFKRLTNGAMTEVMNFAEKLCGTFEQICVDILRHNFDFDCQSGDSDLARNIVAQIPATIEQQNLSICVPTYKIKGTRKDISTVEKLDCQSNPTSDACGADSSQAAITDQTEGCSADSDRYNELDLKLWRLREKQIQQILSIPHDEHCPLYSYSRCKKLGIDFNVGSGVKQNLDPKLLTNGIMVEFHAFATALMSATRHFVTDILEYNFNLNFKNELYRCAFAKQTMEKITMMKGFSPRQRRLPFELLDMTCIEPLFEKTMYCPKCYQDRRNKLLQDISDPGHMNHPCTNSPVAPDANFMVQKPAKDLSPTFSKAEKELMDNYPRCKEVGLSLCVDKDQPRNKLDTHVLTRAVILEVASFARRLCSIKNTIIPALVQHNFNVRKQSRDGELVMMFGKAKARSDGGLAWLDKVFVIHPVSHREPGYVGKVKREFVMTGSERKETILERALALQTKEESAKLPCPNKRVLKSNKCHWSTANLYPICTEIGLDLDVTSKSKKKEKLSLKLLTTAVVLEIHEFASTEVGQYPRTVFDILDHNFDLSSQHYRRWEFSLATASKFQTIAKQYCEKPGSADEVFRLPFMFDPKASERFVQKRQNEISRKTSLHETDLEQKEMRPENSYTYPLEESDRDEDKVRDSGNTGSDDHLPKSCSLSSKIPAESGSRLPLNITDISCSLPTVNSKISPTTAGQPDNKGLCGNEEKTMPTENSPKECELEQEDMEREIMWKLRSNRVEQIISALNNEFEPFRKSKKVGLEFNVGFGPKQNISVDFLSNHVLLEIARFALAINSSQKDFILEILEYNFDLGLHSQNLEHRNNFAFEVMDRVRRLRSGSDAITFSSKVFKLPHLMLSVNMANQSANNVNSEPSCISRMENAGTVSRQSVGLYPWCEEIGLKLHVNNPQPHKKLRFKRLTNGAMTEVMNFAEKLCGTFEQICVDILRHNFDFDCQSGDSDQARNIVAQIPATIETQNLSICVPAYKIKGTRKDISTVEKLDCQSNPTSDACGADSSQAAIADQTEGCSADSDRYNELDLKLWRLREKQIQQILSIPHDEHCPLYSYSRCKKLGIDFNVGSGVKQNLDPKLLTNGIMVEFNTFATALVSATRHFVTDILEYNFNLNFKNELYRFAFAKQTTEKITSMKGCRARQRRLPFELPDMTCIEPLFEKTMYCPKCYQDRRNKLLQDISDPGHMNHPCPNKAKDLSPTFTKAEQELMDNYPCCKEVGLSLCVDKDQPRNKLDTHVLTRAVMLEVGSFARRLCSIKNTIIPALVEHNFNIGKQCRDGELVMMIGKAKAQSNGGLAWLDKVFVIHQISQREPGYVGKMKRESAMTGSERKEIILKRKLALQTKEESAKLPSPNASVLKAKKRHWSTADLYPICTEIGLDLDVTSKSREKEKLDLKLLTRGAAVEIHKFISLKRGCYYPGEVFDILDYSFDLSSQHHRRWEFSIATASIFQTISKKVQKSKTREKLDTVVKLPFVFPPRSHNRSVEKKPKKESKKYSKKESDKTQNDNSCVHQLQYYSDVNHGHFFGDVQTEEEHWYYEDATGAQIDPWMMNAQANQSQVNIQMEANNPHYGDVKPELDTEETYHSHYDKVKTESDTGDMLHLVPGEPAGSLGYTIATMWPNSESNTNPESQNEGFHYYVLTEPQGCEGHAMLAVCPSTGIHIKTESDPAGVMYAVPVEAAASQEYTPMDIGQGQASTSIKEEYENVPVDSYQYEGV